MTTVKTGRAMCPKHDRWEGTRISGRGRQRMMTYDCGLTVDAPAMKLVKSRQPQKTAPVCFDCGKEMTWSKRTKKWVCLHCGEG